MAYGCAFGWMGGRYFWVGSTGEVGRLAIAAGSEELDRWSVGGVLAKLEPGCCKVGTLHGHRGTQHYNPRNPPDLLPSDKFPSSTITPETDSTQSHSLYYFAIGD